MPCGEQPIRLIRSIRAMMAMMEERKLAFIIVVSFVIHLELPFARRKCSS